MLGLLPPSSRVSFFRLLAPAAATISLPTSVEPVKATLSTSPCAASAAPVTDLDEIAGVANDSEYGLGAGIWTRDISKAHALAKKLRAGTVWINCYNVFDASLPFGGYKQSGWGREMGHQALDAYTEVKAVTTQL